MEKPRKLTKSDIGKVFYYSAHKTACGIFDGFIDLYMYKNLPSFIPIENNNYGIIETKKGDRICFMKESDHFIEKTD